MSNVKMKYFAIYFLIIINLVSASEPTSDFNHRISFQVGANPNFTQLSSINNLNFSYANRYSNFWFDYNFQIASGLFQKMTMNNLSATAQSDFNLINSKSSHTSLGIGAMIESNYSKTLFGSDDLYETSEAFLTYNSFKTNAVSSGFTGPGIITKFSICKKFSDTYSIGANLNYVLASISRPSIAANETTSAQSLTLSYITLGIDFNLTL